MQFDHIGVVTATLAQGREALQAIFDIREWTAEFPDAVNKVHVQFGRDSSGICYELIAPFGNDAPVTKALSSGRNILNHVAYLVPDLAAGRERLREAGSVPTSEPNPGIAYGGNNIQFFVTPMRFIIELIEAPGHEHQYLPAN